MREERGRYLSSRYKTETCSRLGENTTDVYGIVFTTVSFLLNLFIKFLQSNKPVMHIN